jgi:hypothetical protein
VTRSPQPGKWRYPKTAPTPGKQCKDCVAQGFGATKRPAPYEGPRCATHHNERRRAQRMSRAVRHVENTYGLTAQEYDELYRFQGGRCAICRRATGASKRLAVDHDHVLARQHGHPEGKGCGSCCRGLLCSLCNDTLAHLRDDPAAFERAADYLRNWPTKKMGLTD